MQRRKRVPRPLRIPMLIKSNNALHQIDSILAQIDNHGTLNVDERGVAVYFNHMDGQTYETAPALRGVRDFFEMWSVRHGQALQLAALEQFIEQVDQVRPISDADISAMQVQLAVLRCVASRMSPADAADLVRQTQVKEAMEVLQA